MSLGVPKTFLVSHAPFGSHRILRFTCLRCQCILELVFQKCGFHGHQLHQSFFQGLTRLQRLLQRDQCHRQILGFNKCILCGICWTVMSKMTPVTCCKCSPQIYLERLTKSSKSLSFKTALNFFFKASTSNGFSRADSLRKCVSAKAQSWFIYLWVLECFRETRALLFHMCSKKQRPSTSHQLLARPACQVCQHSQAMQVAGEAVGRRCTPAVMGPWALLPVAMNICCVCLTRTRSQLSGCP